MANIVEVDRFLRDRGMRRVICLFENIRVQLLLLLTVGVNTSGSSIDWLLHASLSLPIGRGAHDVALGLTIILRLFAIEVSTSEDGRLQVLEFLIAAVRLTFLVAALHRRASTVSHLRLGVLPVTVRRHECAVALTLVVSIGGGRVAVHLTSLGFSSASYGALRPGNLLGCLDHSVVVATLVVLSIITEEDRGALGLASKALAARSLRDRVSKDATLEGVLLSAADIVALSLSKSTTCERACVAHVSLAVSTDG